MPYGLIVLVGSITFTGAFVFATKASCWWKAVVVGLLVASCFWRYGLFLQAGLGVGLSLYFTYLKARA